MFAKKQRPVNILHCIVTVHGACGCLLCAAGMLPHVVNLSHGKDLVACSLLLLLGLLSVDCTREESFVNASESLHAFKRPLLTQLDQDWLE